MARHPLPYAIKEEQGTLNPSRELKNKPRLALEVPDVPPDIAANPDKLEIWNRLAAVLMQMRVVSVADFSVMQRFVDYWWMRGNIIHDIQTNGLRDADTGKVNPAVMQLKNLDQLIIQTEAALGITPSARTKVQQIVDGEDNGAFDFLDTGEDD